MRPSKNRSGSRQYGFLCRRAMNQTIVVTTVSGVRPAGSALPVANSSAASRRSASSALDVSSQSRSKSVPPVYCAMAPLTTRVDRRLSSATHVGSITRIEVKGKLESGGERTRRHGVPGDYATGHGQDTPGPRSRGPGMESGRRSLLLLEDHHVIDQRAGGVGAFLGDD